MSEHPSQSQASERRRLKALRRARAIVKGLILEGREMWGQWVEDDLKREWLEPLEEMREALVSGLGTHHNALTALFAGDVGCCQRKRSRSRAAPDRSRGGICTARRCR